MAGTFVGTPSRRATDVETLASILQGESSTVAGQCAVAQVMINRAKKNFGEYGTTIIAQALAPMQFQGQVDNPGRTPRLIAERVLNGLDPVSPEVGDALYYAASSGAGVTAKWAKDALTLGQGIPMGGNTFWADDKGARPTPAPIPAAPPPEPSPPVTPQLDQSAAAQQFFATIVPIGLQIAQLFFPAGRAAQAIGIVAGGLGLPGLPGAAAPSAAPARSVTAAVFVTLPPASQAAILAAGYSIV